MGKYAIDCQLELISENGLAKVKFMFKKKKFVTASHLRMVAIKTSKLDDYGFTLKVCQCCKYFTPNIDGSTNMVKGFCSGNYPHIQIMSKSYHHFTLEFLPLILKKYK